VIVWDADAYSYPLVHPSWFYSKVFGDSLEGILDEERRLLYVAITRAEDRLFILFDGEISPFLKGIAAPFLDKIDNYVRDAVIRERELQLIVSNGFDIKEALKTGGFRFNAIDKTWVKTVPYSEGLKDAVREMERRPPDWLVAARREKVKVQLRSQSETVVI
jgi:DNA helicase-4